MFVTGESSVGSIHFLFPISQSLINTTAADEEWAVRQEQGVDKLLHHLQPVGGGGGEPFGPPPPIPHPSTSTQTDGAAVQNFGLFPVS